MATFHKRISDLEEKLKDQSQVEEIFYISEELYSQLDLAQEAHLPDHVKVKFDFSVEELEAFDAFLNDEISHQEFEKILDKHREPVELTDKDFEKCIEKYDEFGYNWTTERLEELKAGRMPTD